MALNNDANDANVVAAEPTSSPTPAETLSESPSPSPSATQSASEAPARKVSVAVYYLGGQGNEDPKLYREFHSVPLIEGDRIQAALTEMFRGKPVDADYTSLWSANNKTVTVNRVTKTGDTAMIDLSQEATRLGVGSGSAEVTMQQLVHTVTAADPAVTKVTLRINGRVVPDLWGHIRVGTKAFQRAPALDVQSLIWLLAPEESESVGPTVQIKGIGTAFEGTISWDVRTLKGKLVKEGFTQGGANGTFAEFADQVALAPGSYVMRAFESSAEDGRPLHIDDKKFTVE